jgi:starch synthase (maltosyl-transferring)
VSTVNRNLSVVEKRSSSTLPDRDSLADGRCRAVVERLMPEIDGGRYPIKRAVGDMVEVSAWIHADGHDQLAAVLRYRAVPRFERPGDWLECPLHPLGNDEWAARFEIAQQCSYEYTVEAWVDGFASWRHELQVKVRTRQDVTSELLEGSMLLRAAAERARAARAGRDARWLEQRADLVAGPDAQADRADAALDDRLAAAVRRFPDRTRATTYDRILSVSVDRGRARFGAWYEMFPRSWGPDSSRSGTLREAEAHLRRVAAMGFDVVYLPPIHPIGERFRKGRGNSLTAEPGDPGSPWAIGSSAGGHKAIEPGLGTLDDFDHFIAEARRLGVEIALDLAFQCSPDHPYVREHPEWFRHRPDGTIKYAENPPKKYQDIYPFDFECEAWPELWVELKSIVEFWIEHGVMIFRVDNPHTKPYRFWEWLIREIRDEYPDVIFLAEAFTRPKVMYYLAKLGFSQSYTYFTWRNAKDELSRYFSELTGTDVVEFFRPNLFANTPDILHAYLQQGGPAAFRVRLILASMLGATYGIYSGFELCENRAVPGSEEYLESEKYQYRNWNWDAPDNIKALVTTVNRIRRDHPALQFNRGLVFCATDNPNLIAFCKISSRHANAVLVVINLDCANMQHGWVQVPIGLAGLAQDAPYEVIDLLDDERYVWQGEWNYVRLAPFDRAAHIFELPVAVPESVRCADEVLRQFLPTQRWFAGKARTIARARLADWAPADAPGGLVPTIAEVQYADGGEERYFMPIAVTPESSPENGGSAVAQTSHGLVVDAVSDDAACRSMLATLLDQHSLPMRHGLARARTYGRSKARPLRIHRSSVEQSNSGIVFGNRYILKLLRRLEPGLNPELEISRFLTRHGFSRMPPLAASLSYVRAGEDETTLALLQGFVTNTGTGWERAVSDVRHFLERTSAPTPDAVGFRALATILGERTADLHLALASDDSDPAFAPQPLTGDHLALVLFQLERDAERVLASLRERLAFLPPAARAAADAILDARSRLRERITELRSVAAGSKRTRVHGDFHLGQVLSTGEDFLIIDFEGEPARSLSERRAKQSPLKDVAGMLRSFGYAAHATVLTHSDGRSDLQQMEAAARIWESTVSTDYLARYRETMSQAGLVPSDDRGFAELLDIFMLDKALYELRYELASRPEWITIPLTAIRAMLDAGQPRLGIQ